ncbi:hypothetical protein [Staphylococcus ratti]|uniref:Phage protein n=1 Tax=Staphylococcus ratti TaxID=2892440 RepID=A0ABY3PAA1_9STAP|nr:hypothetical protein [Staphylococcus ratti]UEX89236.1 hypothetical protein LN051_06525 [Staphylococcus ratti]
MKASKQEQDNAMKNIKNKRNKGISIPIEKRWRKDEEIYEQLRNEHPKLFALRNNVAIKVSDEQIKAILKQ